jgi:hypothetical protein
MMLSPTAFMLRLSVLGAALGASQAAFAGGFRAGDQVLVDGLLRRKCAARVVSLHGGTARLSFERPACGESSRAYPERSLQHLAFVQKYKDFRKGDAVLLDGYFAGKCAGTVKAISRGGYAAVELDSPLCADTETLRKTSEFSRIAFVNEAGPVDGKFSMGQKVLARGINDRDTCAGRIVRLTSNGYAKLAFEALTCGNSGKLYPLGQLQAMRDKTGKRRMSGNEIFQRVMREIASAKKARGRL